MLTKIEQNKRENLKKNKPLVYDKIIRYEEKIKKQESIALIVLNYDYICNFNCNHCCSNNLMNRDILKRKLTPVDVKYIYEQGDKLGLAQTAISGGETLVYSDLNKVVEAINPEKWFIAIDTNGWLLDNHKAKHLKNIGIDKVQISLDSFDPKEHDSFRNKQGSYGRVMNAISASKKAELDIILMTTVWKDRVYSKEFMNFLDFCKEEDITSYITLAKPIGNWSGKLNNLCGQKEINYIKELEKEYNLTTRFSPGYGSDLGCIAMKRSITITKYGDIFPCPYIQTSIGNIFNENLETIIKKGLNIKWFSYNNKYDCLSGNKDGEFVQKYMPKIWGLTEPISYNLVFSEEDFIKD